MRRPTLRTTLGGLLAASLLSLGTACGGGGGGSRTTNAAFLTADPRGMTRGGASYDGVDSAAAPGAEATEAGRDLARELEEADLHRVEGDRLFLLNMHRGLVVVDLAAGEVEGRLPLSGFPHEMFVRGDRALVLLTGHDGRARLLDVSLADPAQPSLTIGFDLEGEYRASRLSGEVLYVVTGGAVASFRVGATLDPVATILLPHPAGQVHARDGWIVVAGWGDGGSTPIDLVDASDPGGGLALRGGLEVAGWIADPFKLDLAGDVLRVVAHDVFDGGLSRLTTIDVSDPDAPSVLATLGLARGEQLFATRFDGNRAYLVTFEQVDPLWVLDLSDPHAPKIAGSLVVPGWSTHLVPTGDDRLVAVGVETDAGWSVVVSLFDVSNPALPTMLDRANLGAGYSFAFEDVKGLGVFPAEGLVLVPLSTGEDRLAVLDLEPTRLVLRGGVPMEGTVVRGLTHAQGLLALSTEEVAVVDPASLADRRRCTIAERVVDVARLADGRLLPLVARRRGGRLGELALPCVPERLFAHGDRIAVTGWDEVGRVAYVADFSTPTPTLSERFDLGGAWYVLGDPAWGFARPEGGMGGGYGSAAADALLLEDGRLIVHGLPGGGGGGGGDDGVFPGPFPLAAVRDAPMPGDAGLSGPLDGFVVLDVARGVLEAPIEVAQGYVTGFVGDGADLLYTVGGDATADREGRPRMRHDLVRIHVATRLARTTANVPGWVLSGEGDLVLTVEERWTQGWSYEHAVVALSVDAAGVVTIHDRHVLPEGAYDLRAAGATLFFTQTAWDVGPIPVGPPGVGGGGAEPGLALFDVPGAPTTTIGTLRLGLVLVEGPRIESGEAYLFLLRAEDGSALLVRHGTTLEQWDVSGAEAVLGAEADVGSYPLLARPGEFPGTYDVVLGYGGVVAFP